MNYHIQPAESLASRLALDVSNGQWWRDVDFRPFETLLEALERRDSIIAGDNDGFPRKVRVVSDDGGIMDYSRE